MTWAKPENITGFQTMFKYIAGDIFPNFPLFALASFFIVLTALFSRRAQFPQSVTAAAFLTWTAGIFFFLMGTISAYVITFIGVFTAFCVLWTWVTTEN